jgi:hypothetical protein
VLAPGDVRLFDVPLVPLRLRGHHGATPPAPARHGAATVVCRVAHGATPIDAAARARTAIGALLAWQQRASSRPVVVHTASVAARDGSARALQVATLLTTVLG